MGDEDDRGAVLSLHLRNQPQNLRVNGDVERSRRFVGDDEPRVTGEREGDQHALAHATRQLMRILPQQIAGIGQSGRRQRGNRALTTLFAAFLAKPRQMLVELRADRHHRIECSHRLLRNEGNGAAEEGAATCRRHLQQVLALKQQRSGNDLKTVRKQLGNGAADHGLAGTGFADQTKDFAGRQVERKSPDRRYDIAFDLRADHDVFGLQSKHGVIARLPRDARRAYAATRRPED